MSSPTNRHQDGLELDASQASEPTDEAVVRQGSTYLTDPKAAQLCASFADGLDSGIGYSRILDILERQGFDSKTLRRLRVGLLERGDLLAEALARYGILDPSARKLVLVAEQQGGLPQTFEQLAETYQTRFDRKRVFALGLVEPLLLIALGLIVFRNLIGGNLIELTFADNTQGQIADIFARSLFESAIFGASCFGGFYTWLHLPVDFAPRDAFARVWARIPIVSTPARLSAIATFCRYLQQSIASGMTVYQAIDLAAEASNHPGILADSDHAQRHIKDGHLLAESLSAIEALPAEVLEQTDIGEETGRLEERLAQVAGRFDERSVEAFERRMTTYTLVVRYGIIVVVIVMMFMSIAKLDFF